MLGVSEDRVSRHDHFFDRGGSSLSAVRLAVALERVVSLKDITRTPVLADLAALMDAGGAGAQLWSHRTRTGRAGVLRTRVGTRELQPLAVRCEAAGWRYSRELPVRPRATQRALRREW